MLDAMTPDQFRERYAHYLIEQWGDEYQQIGTIAATIENVWRCWAASHSKTTTEIDLAQPEQYKPQVIFPGEKPKRQTPAKRYLSDDEAWGHLKQGRNE